MLTVEQTEHDLKRAITHLYGTFSKYNRGNPVTGGPPIKDSDGLILESRPLNKLGWDELHFYAFRALTTFGTLDDFKRFLPRLLELVVFETDSSHCPDPQIVLGKIAYAEKGIWPQKSTRAFNGSEKSRLQEYLIAWWRFDLVRLPRKYRETEVLESIGCTTLDIAPYLVEWGQADGIIPAVRLAMLVNHSADEIYKRRELKFCYWEKNLPCREQLMQWLKGPVPRGMLERAFYAQDANQYSGAISEAVSVLEHLQAQVADGAR